MALRLKCSQIFSYVGAVRAQGTEGSATFRPARQSAHHESIILCSGGSMLHVLTGRWALVAAKSHDWRMSAGICGIINVARPVSFEIEHEAISRLQETSVALIHLQKCLFLFRTHTGFPFFLFWWKHLLGGISHSAPVCGSTAASLKCLMWEVTHLVSSNFLDEQ